MSRRSWSPFALGLICSLLLQFSLCGTVQPVRSAPDHPSSGDAAALILPLAFEQPLASTEVAAPAPAGAAGGAASGPAAAVVPPPRPTTPWVETFRASTLWASDRRNADPLGPISQWTRFRLLSPPRGARLEVEYPGDGVSQLPQRGWIDAADVGPSGPTRPEYFLTNGGFANPTSGVQVPRRIAPQWPQGITAEFAALVDGDSGALLWGRNAYGQVAPASLTKIVTTLVALDRARLTDRVDVSVDSRNMPGSTIMGLTPGESLSLETLLYGLMLPSGNDAALAIAQYVAGSQSAFAELMNAKATSLGLIDSHFVNPHGLDANGHYSSAYDLTAFARKGMSDPTFYRLASTRHYEAEGYSLNNLNRLLGMYPKADGVKVGYTDAAGRAIVASAVQDGHRVYAALLRSASPTTEAQALLEWAFTGFTWP
jgi:hypothetical protein